MSILLDFLYICALLFSSPVWLYRMIRHGRYRGNLGQRFGDAPIRYGLQPTIWISGVSVGEIKAAQTLVKELHAQLPDYRLVISSWTDTGLAEARRLYEPDHTVFARPLDLGFAVRRALGRVRPDLVVLVEGDLWPNFLAACNRRRIPVVIVNGRMSIKKGYPRYRKFGSLPARALFNRLSAIGVQDEVYAERFRSLGTDPARVHVTGMMKFDREVAGAVDGQERLAASLGIVADDLLVVAGGTGDQEEKIVLDVFGRLKARHARAKLAIVPRKPERFEEVARLIVSAGLVLIRRSARADGAALPPPDPSAVILGDTMGELRKFYALASCVFVGRSLVPMGGSDMIESAALGKATAFGPHVYNFPQAQDLAAHGCAKVADADGLYRRLDQWLSDPAGAASDGRAAQEFIRRQQGATGRNVQMICRVLGRVPPRSPGAIATDEIRQEASA